MISWYFLKNRNSINPIPNKTEKTPTQPILVYVKNVAKQLIIEKNNEIQELLLLFAYIKLPEKIAVNIIEIAAKKLQCSVSPKAKCIFWCASESKREEIGQSLKFCKNAMIDSKTAKTKKVLKINFLFFSLEISVQVKNNPK